MTPPIPFLLLILCIACLLFSSTAADIIGASFDKRGASAAASQSLQVHLGYSVYQGYRDAASDLNIWRGIRYAAPPTGANRWQSPRHPENNLTSVISASTDPPKCPQANNAPYSFLNWQGDEDCLFLNVYAPQNAEALPVFVWIHGGGYGTGDANSFPMSLVTRSGSKMVGVAIQYRLGAFGFLASNEVKEQGVLNAGLLDQRMALEWVRDKIHLFGGNASKITIGGHSAGAGAALLQATASEDDGSSDLFSNIIAASPYLPQLYKYNSSVPTSWYDALTGMVGCGRPEKTPTAGGASVYECLVKTPSSALQFANANISASGAYGSWTFLPVLDGTFWKTHPIKQLNDGRVQGQRVLSGNVANEGPAFVPQNITSEKDLRTWLRLNFPMLSESDGTDVLKHYIKGDFSDRRESGGRYATNGLTGRTALTTSAFATGYQQVANNIYSEANFACPSYWLADAFSHRSSDSGISPTSGYKYQYSVPAAQHGADLAALHGSTEEQGMGPDLSEAFQLSWSNFIVKNDPSIPIKYANGRALGMGNPGAEKLDKWPNWQSSGDRRMINWNQTGGEEYEVNVVQAAQSVVQYRGKWLRNWLDVYDAWNWEGERGGRWASLSPFYLHRFNAKADVTSLPKLGGEIRVLSNSVQLKCLASGPAAVHCTTVQDVEIISHPAWLLILQLTPPLTKSSQLELLGALSSVLNGAKAACPIGDSYHNGAMKLLTKEEEAAHYRATLQGGIIAGVGGLAVGALGVWGATRRYPAFNQLTLPLKAFLVTSSGTFAGIIGADHGSRGFQASQNPADQAYASHEEQRRQAEISGMTWTERAMAWGREERYKIVGASWVASMVAAFAIVGRNPHLTGQQKLVQARVYAQGLTLLVLVASAAFELQDKKDEKGKYETVEYIDEKDHKKHTKQVEREQPADGDTMWKDMVKQEEERLKERDDAIKQMEARDRKRRAKEPRKPHKHDKDEEQKKKKEDSHGDGGGEGKEEEEGEEEDEEYQPVPGKKGEGKMMRKASDQPEPGVSAVP